MTSMWRLKPNLGVLILPNDNPPVVDEISSLVSVEAPHSLDG